MLCLRDIMRRNAAIGILEILGHRFFAMKCSGRAWYLSAAFVVLALLTRITYAHPFWIQPENFRPPVGANVPLHLEVGVDFKGEPVVYAPEQFNRYFYTGPNGEHEITGTLGDDPAGRIAIDKTGFYTIGYYSKKFEVTFDDFTQFEEYLKLEGLERNRDVAEKRFKIRKGILELYQRCAKSLVKVGDPTGPVDHVLGLPIELIAETDPYAGDGKLRVRLLYRGEPLENALVIAFNKKDALNPQRVRTDKDGHATIKLDKSGEWLLNAVHMIPTGVLSRADWESFWASLTFERP
jgi:Domain of unknown function (DUF4198)